MTESRINRAHAIDLEDLDVVVVDDSKPMQTIVRSILNAARVHRIRTFDHAGDAYRSMLVEPPHLLITDWNLPDSDGITLVRSMRDPRSGPLVAVPAILITGHATRRLVEKAIASGVHFVLAKPLSPSSVLKRVEAVRKDDRRFLFDASLGHFVLAGAADLLAGQRQRWRDMQEGTPRPLPAQAAPRRAPTITVVQPKAPESKPAAKDPGDRRRAFGLGAPRRDAPVETSTGQVPSQAS